MSGRIRNIVVGVDEPGGDDPYLAAAAATAKRAGAALHVVHAFHVPDPAMYPYPEMSMFSPRAIDELSASVQQRLDEHVRRLAGDADVSSRAMPAPADIAVLDVAREVDADLIVVGASRRSRVGRALLGTTAQRVVRSATAPVLVVRRSEVTPHSRVLFATDLSDLSANALKLGMTALSDLDGAERERALRILLIVNYDMPLPPPLGDSAVDEVADRKLQAFLERVDPEIRGDARAVRVGDPADEIVAEATDWDADLIVLGTHGRTGASRFLIGSVAESALKNAPCDVLVIPNALSAAAQ